MFSLYIDVFVYLWSMENVTVQKFYSKGEELANTISHAVGILMGIIVGYFLLRQVSVNYNFWGIASISLYLFGMLSSYVTSTLYHAHKHNNRKEKLRKFDHAAIYLHIAGTYAPFCLIVLRSEGIWGWALFTFIYIAAVVGVIMSFRKLKRHSHIETACFVIMGTSILIAIKPLYDALSLSGQSSALFWLIMGGISYIIGALFYSWTKRKYMHFVFHLFVLGGSVCHIMAIYMII